MTAFERYTPPNMPSLSAQDRVAWGGLNSHLARLETHIAEGGTIRSFGSIAERDAFFTDPQIGNLAFTYSLNGNDTEPNVLWVYSNHTATGGNVLQYWAPFDQHWVRYTPTLTNLTDGTQEAFYKRSGITCEVQWQWQFTGGAPAVGTNPTFTLPFAGLVKMTGIVGGAHTFGNVFLVDNDSTDAFGCCVTTATSFSSLIVQYQRADTTFVANGSVTSTAPFTWANLDRMIAQPIYEMDVHNIAPFTV